MFDLNKIVRSNIKKLKPYTSARDEFSGEAKIYLDANENSSGSVVQENHNRYPDPKHLVLRQRLAELKKTKIDNVFVGNGSDEAIDLLIRIFCEPSKDSILTLYPSYGMYQVSAETNDISVKSVSLNSDYSLDVAKLLAAIEPSVKLIFICNPNNPTANVFAKEDIKQIIQKASEQNVLVVVDEAYIDFCEEFSMQPDVNAYSNLVVLQTLSKAWGLAEIRLGMAYASQDIISLLYKVKAPYNVNGITQQIALAALNKEVVKEQMVSELIAERERVLNALAKIDCVEQVYDSKTSFIFAKFKDPEKWFKTLLAEGVVVRDRSKVPQCEGCFRITLGTKRENDALLAVLSGKKIEIDFKSNNNDLYGFLNLPQRKIEIRRDTSETKIFVSLNLDGSGTSSIETGLDFFDHMLTQIAKHGGVDLVIKCQGDLKVDEHHTIEDVAIALGEAFHQALGNKAGLERYGFLLPMDESLAQVAIDFSGRSWLVWDAEFKREKIGDMPTEMFKHFFKSFSDSAKCNLNIKVSGDNEHHKIEAIFKALARSIKQAVKRDTVNSQVPSSKGVL